MAKPYKTRVFWSGGSQAVRLPKEFRFEADEVLIRREGARVILEPVKKRKWPSGFWERLDAFGPLSKGFKRPRALPRSRHRDAVLREWIESMNQPSTDQP